MAGAMTRPGTDGAGPVTTKQGRPGPHPGPSPLLRSLMLLTFLYSAGEYAGWSFYLLYSHRLGYSLLQVVVLNGLYFGSALAVLFLLGSVNRYTSFKYGLTLKAILYILMLSPWAFQMMPLLVVLAGFAVNLWAQIAIHRIRDEAKSHGPIANVVRAFVLYGVAMVLALKPGWVIPALIFYVLFEVVLKLRPERAQV